MKNISVDVGYYGAKLRDKGSSYLELNLSLGNLLRASAAVGNLLGLGNLGANGLCAEVLDGVGLNGVDAENGVGLNDSKSTGN